MALITGRVVVIVAATLGGVLAAPVLGMSPLVSAMVGAGAGAAAVALEVAAGRVPLGLLLWTTAGTLAGLAGGLLVGMALAALAGGGPAAVLALPAAWVGGAVAARRWRELPAPLARAGDPRPCVLDTSVIVDGRITDVVQAGFLDGLLIAPLFVVRELQHLADAPDPLRRGRGRRGFDVLEQLRRSSTVRLEVVDAELPELVEVDAKLVALARARGARLLTNDVALARMASLGGVAVASLQALASAVRPVAMAGETLVVQVVREGREPGQGVGYLDDGTMLVVEGGKRVIGQLVDVVVTSVRQTSVGRMVFARLREEDGREA